MSKCTGTDRTEPGALVELVFLHHPDGWLFAFRSAKQEAERSWPGGSAVVAPRVHQIPGRWQTNFGWREAGQSDGPGSRPSDFRHLEYRELGALERLYAGSGGGVCDSDHLWLQIQTHEDCMRICGNASP